MSNIINLINEAIGKGITIGAGAGLAAGAGKLYHDYHDSATASLMLNKAKGAMNRLDTDYRDIVKKHGRSGLFTSQAKDAENKFNATMSGIKNIKAGVIDTLKHAHDTDSGSFYGHMLGLGAAGAALGAGAGLAAKKYLASKKK